MSSGVRFFKDATVDPQPRNFSKTLDKLFPFTSNYSFYAGGIGADPSKYQTSYSFSTGKVPRAGTLVPAQAVRLPVQKFDISGTTRASVVFMKLTPDTAMSGTLMTGTRDGALPARHERVDLHQQVADPAALRPLEGLLRRWDQVPRRRHADRQRGPSGTLAAGAPSPTAGTTSVSALSGGNAREVPMTRLRHDERGFSLMELMMAMAIGSIVLTMVMSIFVTGLTRKRRSATASTRPPRGASPTASRMLPDAQTCVDGNAPLLDAPVRHGDVLRQPRPGRRRSQAVPRALRRGGRPAVGGPVRPVPRSGVPTWPTTPSRSRLLAGDILPQGGKIFSERLHVPGATAGQVDPSPLATPATASDRQQVVRVGVDVNAVASRTKADDATRTVISGQAVVASADPVQPQQGTELRWTADFAPTSAASPW